ncbi:hypothetical protein [Mucilaginibacter sp. PAMB04168]|uniref:hypothetical protein n=1 Tax=Mucilaginibacter sp. PAMB04168 TaxID=3138567 RepID=UPI0031F6A1AF
MFSQALGAKHYATLQQYHWLFHNEKADWLNFYDATCKPKNAAELKVLYLSGPEPLNDIEVLVKYGIRLENIWAIEADNKTYDQALASLIQAGVHIKLHRGKLDEFFELVNHEFDIIYYDACSPVISSNGSPLEVLKQIFAKKRMTGLSALITNFAEPGDQYNWGDVLGCWFATKDTYEVPETDNELGMEVFRKIEHFDYYSKYIGEHLHEYYDAFLNHFIPAFAAELIPMWQTLSLGSLSNRYLLNEQELFKKLNAIRNHEVKVDIENDDWIFDVPHFALAVDAYPLLNWASLIREKFPSDHLLNRFLNEQNRKVSIEDALYVGSLLKRFEETNGGFKTFILEICNERLSRVLQNIDFFDRDLHLTCDIPMKNLLVEILFGIYGYPYIAHAGRSLSLKYKAKETTMFSNVFIFDQCRYLYDYLPTPELWESFFKNVAQQTIIRANMDEIRRNHLALNSSLFKWSFIEGICAEFGQADLREREDLNGSLDADE